MSFFYLMPSLLLSGFMFPFVGMLGWAQALGTLIPVTHFLRIVRGSLLRGESFAGNLPNLAALSAFVLIVSTLALRRYNTRLD